MRKVLTLVVLLLVGMSSVPGIAEAHSFTVTCGAGQRAIVQSGFVGGEPVTTARCVDTGYVGTRSYSARPVVYERPYQTQYRYYPTRVRRHRSWAKSALIIGGSAGTGAGVGGILRGKKGALIGAALAGGAASIYEGTRRR